MNSACPVAFALTLTRIKGCSHGLPWGRAAQARQKLALRGQSESPAHRTRHAAGAARLHDLHERDWKA
ncbi:hypothetical protein [Comamonas sp.]|uniref:hypothetical protein n=1 Tax=Comamonas sp. TaxID=34028 RepID=UPI0025C653A4|nr:hypothetical protein [Comamonas sp.]